MAYLLNGQTFKALKITSASLQHVSLGAGMLRLSFASAADAAAAFANGAAVALTQEGVTLFRGKVRLPSFTGTEVVREDVVDVVDWWFDFSETPYLNKWKYLKDLGQETLEILNQLFVKQGLEDVRIPMTLGERIAHVVNYAADKGVPVQSGASLDLVSDDFYPNDEGSKNPYCHDTVRAQVESALDWVIWTDYTTDPPTVNATKRAAVDAPEILTMEVGTPPLAGVNVIARYDLQVTGVVIVWLVKTTLEKEAYPPEATLQQKGVMSFRRSAQMLRSPGFAQRYYEVLNDLIWEGTISLVGAEIDHALKPGRTINISGGREEWATMRGFVQGVTHDLMTGRTELALGMPRHLGDRDIKLVAKDHERYSYSNKLDEAEDEANELAENGEPEPEPEPLPDLPGPSGGLTGYAAWERIDPDLPLTIDNAKCMFRVAPGPVSGGDIETPGFIPYFEYSSTPLNAFPPPGLEITPGTSLEYYLFVEIEPDTQEFVLEEEAEEPDPPVEFTEWRAMSAGEVTVARVVFADNAPPPSAPTVNPSTGSVSVKGRFYFSLGNVTWLTDATAPIITSYRSGAQQVMYAPPERVYLIGGGV